jgi:hypothetical protein
MGTLPAQRGREHAGIGLQNRSSRGNLAQANDARPDGGLSIPSYRKVWRNQNGSEPCAYESCDGTEQLERRLVKLGDAAAVASRSPA